MAMLPFIGYNAGDYIAHWLEMGKKIPHLPKIFHVNWFRTDSNGKFMWPGFGENLRVLLWVIDRCQGKIEAEKTPIGFVPKRETLDLEGLTIGSDTVAELLKVDRKEWIEEVNSQTQFFDQIGSHLPAEVRRQRDLELKRLQE